MSAPVTAVSTARQTIDGTVGAARRPEGIDGFATHSAASDARRDEGLVAAFRAGSTCAFDALVQFHAQRVIRIAVRITNDAEEARDVAQDAFLRAYLRFSDLAPGRAFAPWLYLIARNAAFDELRRQKRAARLMRTGSFVKAIERSERDLEPELRALRKDDSLRIAASVSRLPAKYRQVLELYFGADLKYREVADGLGIPLATVKTHIRRAKSCLREQLVLNDVSQHLPVIAMPAAGREPARRGVYPCV